MSVPTKLSDLKTWNVRRQIFLVDLYNYACTVLPRTTAFGKVTLMAGAYFYGVNHALSQGAGSQGPPPIFWDPLPTQFDTITRGEGSSSHAHQIRWCGDPTSQKCGTYYRTGAHRMRNRNQMLRGDQTGREEIYHMVDHASCSGHNFW